MFLDIITEYQTRGVSLPFLHYNLCSNLISCNPVIFLKDQNHLLRNFRTFVILSAFWLEARSASSLSSSNPQRLLFKCPELLFRINLFLFYLKKCDLFFRGAADEATIRGGSHTYNDTLKLSGFIRRPAEKMITLIFYFYYIKL